MDNFSSDGGVASMAGDKQVKEELQEFMYFEQQKEKWRTAVHQLTDLCWNKCIEKPQAKLDQKSEACLENCAARFVDATLLLANRYAHVLKKAASV